MCLPRWGRKEKKSGRWDGETAVAMFKETVIPFLKRHYPDAKSYLVMVDGDGVFSYGIFLDLLREYAREGREGREGKEGRRRRVGGQSTGP